MTSIGMPRRKFILGRTSRALVLAGLVSVAASTPSSAQWVSPWDAYALAGAWRGGAVIMPQYSYGPGYGAYAYGPVRTSPSGYPLSPWDGNRPSTFEENPGF